MKKIGEIIRPFVAIVFGALLFLFYLNWLSLSGAGLAVGIIAMVLAAYYLTVGILGILLGEKLGKARAIFDMLSIVLFGVFMFVYFLIVMINGAEAAANEVNIFGPAGWFIVILSISGSLAFAVVHLIASLVKNKVLARLDYLFAAIFVLVLLLNLLFDSSGDPINLGALNVLLLVIYALFAFMLFNSLPKPNGKPQE